MSEETQTRMADAREMPKTGERIGDRYRVDSILGEGGFAVVFKCHDERTHTDVAVKVLDPMMSSRADFRARFDREVKTVSSLRHHHTIKIFDNGTTDRGCAYLVMELLKGEDLDSIIEKGGAMDPARVQRITIQVLKSLHEAHSKQIVHRDLKPANVFIADIPGETDYVKVLDFGIAKSQEEGQNSNLTATGQIMCSPDYVAPERVVQSLTFPSSDLYSLGIMMIEMLSGELPYKGETPIAVALQHARVDAPVPIPEDIELGPLGAIVRRAVDKQYEARYQSAEDMLADLVAVRFDGVGPYLTELNPAVGAGARGNATIASPAIAHAKETELMSTFDVPVESSGISGTLKIAAAAGVLVVGGAVVALLLLTKSPAIEEPAPAEEIVAIAPVEEEPVAVVEPEAPEPTLSPAEQFRAVLPATVMIQSIPSGATIFMGDEPLGLTPYTFNTDWIKEVPLTLEARLDGHETTQVTFTDPDELRNLRSIQLEELPQQRSSSRSSSSSRTSDTSSSGASSTASSSGSGAGSSSSGSSSSGSSSASEEDAGGRGRIGAIRVRN